MTSVRRVNAIVGGQVQGVGFRMSARREAVSLGLSGFARNLSDGRVEVEVEGADAAVDELVRWLWSGPRFATVRSVELVDKPSTGQAGFIVF
jgi:acylphosphatase